MEFIFSNSNRQKKSYRDKNSKLVDKKIQNAAVQSDSEFYNGNASVASAPIANLRRDKSKRATQVSFFIEYHVIIQPHDFKNSKKSSCYSCFA